MTGITKKQYKEAEAKIEELLPLVDDETPANDPNYIELMRVSDIVEAYELEHYPIEKLKVMGEKVRKNPLLFKYTAQEIRDLNRNREDVLIAFSKEPEANEILSESEKIAFINSFKKNAKKKESREKNRG